MTRHSTKKIWPNITTTYDNPKGPALEDYEEIKNTPEGARLYKVTAIGRVEGPSIF